MRMPIVGMQLVFALSAAAVLSGCGASDTGSNKDIDWHAQENLELIAAEYCGYIANFDKPPGSLEAFEERWGKNVGKGGIRDGRYVVIWNADPRKQEATSDTYLILAYQAKPGPSGKRWVGRVKQVGQSWDKADPVELTEEEFQKAPKAKPSS